MWRQQTKNINYKAKIEELVEQLIKGKDCTDNVLNFEVYRIKCFETYEQETFYSTEINQTNIKDVIKYIIDKDHTGDFLYVSRKNSIPYEKKKKGVQLSYLTKSEKDYFGSKIFTQMNASSEYEMNNMDDLFTPTLKMFLVFLLGLFSIDIVHDTVFSNIEAVTYNKTKAKTKLLFNSTDDINNMNIDSFIASVRNVGMMSYGTEFKIHKFYK